MKHKLFVLVAGFSATFATASFAAEFTVAELLSATKIAVDDFARLNPTHVDHFTGYKAWKSGEESKVKVYVDHSGMKMDFTFACHKHEADLECHAQ